MTQDSLGISAMPMYNDPYLQMSLYTPNYYQMNTAPMQSASGTQQIPMSYMPVQTAQTQPQKSAPKEEKSNHTAAILSILGVAAVGATLYIASRGKAAGAEGFINSVKAGFKSLKKQSKEITMSIVDGKPVYTLPNKSHSIKGADVVAQAKSLGLEATEGLKWTDAAAKVKSYHIELTDGGIANKIIVRDGKVARCINVAENKSFALETSSPEFQKKVQGIIDSVAKKQEPSGAKVVNILYGQEIASGSNAWHIANSSSKNVKDGLCMIRTDRFAHNSEAVYAAKGMNKTFAEAASKAEKADADYSSWSIASAEYAPNSVTSKVTGATWPAGAKLNIQNDKVVSLVDSNGRVHKCGDDVYEALKYQFEEVFTQAPKQQELFTNIKYVVAA